MVVELPEQEHKELTEDSKTLTAIRRLIAAWENDTKQSALNALYRVIGEIAKRDRL